MGPVAPIPPTPPLEQIAQGQALTAGLLQATGQASGAAGAASASPLASFQDFFANAINNAGRFQDQAADQERDMVTGVGQGAAGTDDFHDGFIALEKADLSFQLTMAIRDKVISAYQTIMQMSV